MSEGRVPPPALSKTLLPQAFSRFSGEQLAGGVHRACTEPDRPPEPRHSQATPSRDLIDELADEVERVIDMGDGVFSLRIEPGESPEQRALLIDTHGEVLKELKRRGRYDIRATVTSIEEGEPDGRTASQFPPGSTSQSGSPPTSS